MDNKEWVPTYTNEISQSIYVFYDLPITTANILPLIFLNSLSQLLNQLNRQKIGKNANVICERSPIQVLYEGKYVHT